MKKILVLRYVRIVVILCLLIISTIAKSHAAELIPEGLRNRIVNAENALYATEEKVDTIYEIICAIALKELGEKELYKIMDKCNHELGEYVIFTLQGTYCNLCGNEIEQKRLDDFFNRDLELGEEELNEIIHEKEE